MYIAGGGGDERTMMAFVFCGGYATAAVVSVFVRRAMGQRCDPDEDEEDYYYDEAASEPPPRAVSNGQEVALIDSPSPKALNGPAKKRKGKKS
mmetsp:Transcript_38030/g.87654  ORF Transcript_38030/g.87654 Transcript_38030/m.87654 type:complete len:93 (-) Transcript_38030:391-669(-)